MFYFMLHLIYFHLILDSPLKVVLHLDFSPRMIQRHPEFCHSGMLCTKILHSVSSSEALRWMLWSSGTRPRFLRLSLSPLSALLRARTGEERH